MGELVDRDEEHLRLLKSCYYILAGITGVFSLFPILFGVVGGLIASGTIPMAQGSGDDQRTMGLIFLGFAVAATACGLVSAFVTFLVGRNLRDRRRRTFCLVMAGLSCLYVPWGTAIGVCTIIVLNRPNVKNLFGEKTPLPPIQNTP